ncbi:MAG: hypothetical protein ACR2J9_00405 [Gaiellales bacterium]
MAKRTSETVKRAFSARWSPQTIEAAQRRAATTEIAFNQLIERYAREGLAMDAHPLICFRDRANGRRAMLIGSRLDVAAMIATIRQNDGSVSEAAAYLELPIAKVEACVAYYVDHQDEIDEQIARDDAAAADAESTWRRSHEIFA